MDLLNLTIGANNRALRRERIFRDRENPLEVLTDEQLYSKFRFTRDGIYFLCANCDGLEQITERSCALSTSLKILVGLRYLATGSFQNVVADTIRISQPTVSRTFSSFLNSIQRLSPRLIKWPTQMEQTATRNHFFENFTLPNVVGCIDCTHIQIRAPEQEEEAAYVNRMSYHSINVQAVCDENSIFINLVANKPGSFHDSTILRVSFYTVKSHKFMSFMGFNEYWKGISEPFQLDIFKLRWPIRHIFFWATVLNMFLF